MQTGTKPSNFEQGSDATRHRATHSLKKSLCVVLASAALSQTLPAIAAPFAAVLPGSRSVEVGTTATAFATILNPDEEAATACRIAPASTVDADFFFQTTDPTTNAVTGTPNTPVDIAAGASQSFIFGLTPKSDFAATNVELNFTCSTGTAPIAPGINTLLLSGNSSPTADVVAVSTTIGGGGITRLPRDNQFGLVALATTNVGVDATITAQPADNAGLDGTILICETNQNTAACLDDPAASTTRLIPEDGTATYSVFLNSATRVLLDPTNRRAAVNFIDEFGNVRGATSVAVEGGGPSARTFFDDNVADQIIQAACTRCHSVGGDAAASALVFATDEQTDYKATNFNVLTGYLNADPGNTDALVAAATGQGGHPEIVAADSPAIAIIAELAELLATE